MLDEHVYVDDAVSGADVRKQIARQRLLEVIRHGAPFQALIIREQSRFSRRDGDEAFGELKQIARRGVEVWFYRDRQRFTFGTFADNVVGLVKAEAAADYRRQVAVWTYDAMEQKARAGFVTGGTCFGYDNVRVDGHVERRINGLEATVVADIFRRAAAGDGLKTIAKALNGAGAAAPRAQPGRPRSWTPSSVRDVLHRDVYRGVLTWNKSKKRDAEGQQRQCARPRSEWLSVPAEPLRLVSDAVWQAVHDRLRRVRADAVDAPPQIAGRGIRRRYLLAGFGRCAQCGGSMQAVSRASSAGRIVRYVCGTYWNRGATVCGNGLMADMVAADQAVRGILEREVLRPGVVDRALALAVSALQQAPSDRARLDRGRAQLAAVDAELANLATAVARGGAVPALLEALQQREADRRRLVADLAVLQRSTTGRSRPPGDRRARLAGFLRDWDQLVRANTIEARAVLDGVLADRIRFEPDRDRRRYRLTVPIAFDRVVGAALPELGRGLQESMASPTGFEPVFWP